MLIANKLAFTAVPAPALVTSIQYAITALTVILCQKCGVLEADLSLDFRIIKSYLIVPLLFSLAIFTNGKLLEVANIETFLIFRFSTPLTVGLCDFFMLGKELPSIRSFICFSSIIFGAFLYTLSDEGFALNSYLWAVAYLVVITCEMILVKHVFTVNDMSTWTRVYLNNILSLPFQPLFILGTQE